MPTVCRIPVFLAIFVMAALSPARADLSSIVGLWRLEPENSDNLRRVVAESLEFNDWTQVRFVQTPRGTRQYGRYRQKPTDEQVERAMEFLGTLVPVQPLVRVRRQESLVILEYEGGLERRVDLELPEPGENKQSTATTGDQKLVLAAWEEGALVIETNTLSGARVLERVEPVGPGSNRLKVSITVDVARLPNPVAFARYYQSES